jgi:hypothetical protein
MTTTTITHDHRWPGYGLIALGLLHTAALGVGGAAAIRQLFAHGWWNPAAGDPMRLTPLWSFEFGAFLVVIGWLLARVGRGLAPVSRPLAAVLLALFVLGAVVVPVGGFWLGIPLALWLFARPPGRARHPAGSSLSADGGRSRNCASSSKS